MEKSGGGDAEPVGRVVANTLTCPAVSSNFVTRIRPNHDLVLPRFLLYVLAHLQACRRNIPSIKQTTGIQNLDERDYFNNYIALPPLDEQSALVAWVDNYSTSIRRAIDQANSEIALIMDYRSRLITDVVAGKIDVTRQQFDINNEEELSSLDEFSLDDVDLKEEVDCDDD
jgi:type I restriction enzyme S subunit